MMRADTDVRRVIDTRVGVGATALIIQREALRFSRVIFDQPTLIVVHHGEKTFLSDKEEWVIKSGQAVAVAKGRCFDILNRPDGNGCYRASWLVFEPSMVDVFAGAAATGYQPAHALRRLETSFVNAFSRAQEAIQDPVNIPYEIARHRMEEILLWLDLRGVNLAESRPSTVSQRVREILIQTLDDSWTGPIVARRLNMSEATMRRHLCAENSSLSSILIDVRMVHALSLLQATDLPVGNIAREVGYESASRFASRFRKRFGFAPTAVRGHRLADPFPPTSKPLSVTDDLAEPKAAS